MAREDRQQYNLPMRQQEPGRLTRSPWGWGGADFWTASPFQLMRRMQEDMDRVFSSLMGQPAGATGGQAPQTWTGWAPKVDVYETDKELVIKADLPGVEPEDLEVYCTDDALVLRGETRHEQDRQEGSVHRTERSYGRFERMIPLAPGVKPEQVQANFRNGVLELRVPRSEEVRQRMRRIPIGATAGAKGGEVGAKGGEAGSMTAEKAQTEAPPKKTRSAKK